MKINARTRILTEEYLALEWNKLVSADEEIPNLEILTNRIAILGTEGLLQQDDGYIRPFGFVFQAEESILWFFFSIPFLQQLNRSETEDVLKYALELAKVILEEKDQEKFEKIEEQVIEHIKTKNNFLYSNLVRIENRVNKMLQEFVKRGMRFIKPEWVISSLKFDIMPETNQKLKKIIAFTSSMGKLNSQEIEQIKNLRFRLVDRLLQGKKGENMEIGLVASLQGRSLVGKEQLTLILVSRILFDETIGLKEEDIRDILLSEILWAFLENSKPPRSYMEKEIHDLILPSKASHFKKRIQQTLGLERYNELQEILKTIIEERLKNSSEQLLRL
ncbi:MAG: hypothetical protein ACFFBD_17415 [Candidatus Hodarchaeota archaeon]